MSFSVEWDSRYRENTHMSVWPWSDVVSLVHRHCRSVIAAGGGRVYELGCGAGANIPLFRSLGLSYFATDGSATIVSELQRRYPEFESTITVADFTEEMPFEVKFDIVLDRASLTHNDTESIRRGLRLVFESLKSDGVYIGCDWFSTQHSDFGGGEKSVDAYTRTGFTTGQFAGTGRVHFSDEAHLRDLFSPFELVFLEEKVVQRRHPPDQHQFGSWNLVARKR